MSQPKGSHSPSVLVVDDEAIVRKLVIKGLEPFACRHIYEAENGLEAQRILAEKSFDPETAIDVVITDLMMPELTGLELMAWARDHCPDPLWIILSGLETFDAAVRAIGLGAFDFLPKPIQLEQLRVSIRNSLNQRQLERDKEFLNQQLQGINMRLSKKVIQLEDLCHLLEEQAAVISQDLRRAETIQRALLPSSATNLAGFHVDALFRPGNNVGGDLYDVVRIDERYVAIYIADAAGHGVSAAMLTVILKQRLQMVDPKSREPLRPAMALERVNRLLYDDISSPGLFITAAYCLLDTLEHEITIASAGHPPLLAVSAAGELRSVKRTGPALGLSRDSSFSELTLRLEDGNRVLLHTDGLLGDGSEGSLTPEGIAERLRRSGVGGQDLLRELLQAAPRDVALLDRDDVCMILIQTGEGRSMFDNGDPLEDKTPRPLAENPKFAVLYGEAEDRAYFRILGRGTWSHCEALHTATCETLDAGRAVTIDLSSCEYLDSTFLGTIHDLVCHEGAKGAGLKLQAVQPDIRHLFEELHMERVLETIHDCADPLPEAMDTLEEPEQSQRRDQLRVLRAHELLASLGNDNREQFRNVVEALRADLLDS